MTAKSCTVAMTYFTDDLSYSAGAYIRAEVTSTNDRGTSDLSDPNVDSIVAQTTPTGAPATVNATSTKDTITLVWDEVTADSDTSYSAITYYLVYDTTTTETLIENITAPTTTVTLSSLTPAGDTFTYKVGVENIFGEGSSYTSVSILLAGIPDTMTAPVVTESDTLVVYTFAKPTSNGEDIIEYTLYDYKDSTATDITSYCNSVISIVSATPTCEIDMADFIDNLGYSLGDSITAKVTATNAKGESDMSDLSNTDIVAQDVPQVAVTIDTSSAASTISSIYFNWTALTDYTNDSGYAAITNYHIDMT